MGVLFGTVTEMQFDMFPYMAGEPVGATDGWPSPADWQMYGAQDKGFVPQITAMEEEQIKRTLIRHYHGIGFRRPPRY